ncbi:MAG: nitrite reductase large subunit, partial [Pseudomonadota bacterium]
DSGYQVSIGGAAGMDVKETELLVQVATEEDAIDVIKAVTQLYRENAKYLDRIYKWMAKVGLDWIKEQIDDPETQKALVDRFELSQSIYRKDPWAEHAAKKAESYQPLANLSLEAAE